MGDFIVALQFLTRIRVWDLPPAGAESFGRSVKMFPLVGAVLGAIMAGAAVLLPAVLPVSAYAAVLVAMSLALTGGLHADGLMDTCDGLFSGRGRERILDIMKDSRVGSFGVAGFVSMTLLRWAFIASLPAAVLPLAMFCCPVFGRLAMVAGITLFPYARAEGMGRAFHDYAGPGTLPVASLLAATLASAAAWPAVGTALIAGLAATLAAFLAARRAATVLGGLTGDVYGAITEVAEVTALLVFCLLFRN